jgi:TRAP-type C4-dicarboxylate transport system permease small subunit
MRALIAPLSSLNVRVSRIALWVGSIGLIVMTGITGWQVFGRYVMNDSPQWVERTTLLLVLYFTFLAGAVGVRDESHLGISFISDALPGALRKAVAVIVYLILAGFGGVLAWYGVALSIETWDVATPIIRIPEGVTYFAIPVGGAMIALFAAELALRTWYDERIG